MMSCCCCGSAEPCAAQISIFKHLDSASLEEISNIAIHRTIKKEETYTYGEALSDVRVCIIDRKDFLELLTKHPSISLKLLEEFSRRMRQSAHQTATNAEPVRARLAEYLLNLSAAQDSDTIKIPLQLKELSSYLNTTPETISRGLRELEQQEIIRRERRTITILQKEKLR